MFCREHKGGRQRLWFDGWQKLLRFQFCVERVLGSTEKEDSGVAASRCEV